MSISHPIVKVWMREPASRENRHSMDCPYPKTPLVHPPKQDKVVRRHLIRNNRNRANRIRWSSTRISNDRIRCRARCSSKVAKAPLVMIKYQPLSIWALQEIKASRPYKLVKAMLIWQPPCYFSERIVKAYACITIYLDYLLALD